MKSFGLKNFRCFTDLVTLKIAPITVLVGENSTGKSSVLAAIRAAWDAAHFQTTPDFNDEPFFLGDFSQVVNFRGGRAGRADTFELGFTISPSRNLVSELGHSEGLVGYRAVFEKRGAVPQISRRVISYGEYAIQDETEGDDNTYCVTYRIPGAEWRLRASSSDKKSLRAIGRTLPPIQWTMMLFFDAIESRKGPSFFDRPVIIDKHKSTDLTSEKIRKEVSKLRLLISEVERGTGSRPFAFAPIRTKPERTYNPVSDTPSSEGAHVPVRLAQTFRQDRGRWERLKAALDQFGEESGLFQGIEIRSLGKHESDPFQVQIKISGPARNLIDVGYGVSQVLPILFDIIQDTGPGTYLLQQPEVHLHPKAQAELASFFSVVAANGKKQLIIETHSDFLLDRLRHEVSTGDTIGPDDLSIIYFERSGQKVNVHNISVDKLGNIHGHPPGYRKFFLDEERRILGF